MSILWATRTYGRRQLLGWLACIYASQLKGEIMIVGAGKDNLNPADVLMLDFLDSLGWQVSYPNPINYGIGGNLFNLLKAAITKEADQLLLLDDDVYFTREHIVRLLAAGSNCATYLYNHLEDVRAGDLSYFEGIETTIDMYCSWLDISKLRTIPLEQFELLRTTSSLMDMSLFHKILIENGFQPCIIKDLDRPIHIYITDEKKPWGDMSLQECFESVHNVIDQPDLQSAVIAAQIEQRKLDSKLGLERK